ncbi:MAG TPA: SHOCT domain-containing protein [Solirubrobacteraceae bacterium]|nr:SHOCT domain-containing protein [Solirubrobacteraceae bacterium]
MTEPPAAPQEHTPSRGRRILVDAIIGVTTILLVVGVFSVWANRLLFNPDNWSNTSTQLLANPTIRQTTANYIVDQLYANVNVTELVRSALPQRFQGLAGPAAGALRNGAVQVADQALQRPRVQQLWAQANRAADQLFISVVNGGRGAVTVNNGAVTLDLGSVVDNVASRLGLPSDVSSRLPANIANLTVIQSNHLSFVQKVGKAIRSLALWLTILVPILYALAIFLARGRRRRTLMAVGFAGVFGGILVIAGRSILQTQLTNAITNDASLRPTVAAVVAINTQILGQTAAAVIFGGLVLVGAAWIGGPARPAMVIRRAIAPFLREEPLAAYAITLAVMALIFIWDPIHATGTPAGIIVFTALALFGTYVLREETLRTFPDAQAGATTQALRERAASFRRPRSPAPGPETSTGSTADQLSRLAELREHDAITPEEYESAKAQLLHH